MKTKYFCPICKNEVRVSVTIVPEYSVVCDTCHFNCIGLSDNILNLFDIVPATPTAEEILKAFEEGWKASFDADYKTPKYRES